MNVESDLVDQVCFKQRLREHATTEYANVFTFIRFFQTSHEASGIFIDESYFLALWFLDRA
jgi:hypothetical protein